MSTHPSSVRLATIALVVTTACGGARGKAEAAIASADSSVAAASETGKLFPLDFERVGTTIAAARDTLAKGDPAAAQALVAGIASAVDSLTALAPARRTQLSAELDTLRFAVQQNLAAIQAKVDQFTRTGRPPKGVDPAKLGSIKEVLAAAPEDWAQVEADIKSGALASAYGKATELRLKISDALSAVGLTAGEAAWHNLTLPPG